MEFIKVEHIPDLVVVKFKAFYDERGYFEETFNAKQFKDSNLPTEWVQSNHSHSAEGVLRGMHWQKEPFAQDKYVKVSRGKAIDVAVDIRVGSPTFGKFHMVELTEDNHTGFFIPKGFAHGFLVLSEEAEFVYKCDEFYHPEDEVGIRWDDPTIAIEWPVVEIGPILSPKDNIYPYWVK